MGHSKLNLAIIAAGFLTLGAVFGHSEKADAHTIILPDTFIVAEPIAACTEYRISTDTLEAECLDDGQTYDLEHYMVETDTDGEGFYLGVWE